MCIIFGLRVALRSAKGSLMSCTSSTALRGVTQDSRFSSYSFSQLRVNKGHDWNYILLERLPLSNS